MLDRTRRSRWWIAPLVGALVVGCAWVDRTESADPGDAVGPAAAARRGRVPGGSLRGLGALGAPVADESRAQIRRAADRALDRRSRPTEVLEVEQTDGAFVLDSQAAWTLALAHQVTGERRYATAAGRIVDGWVGTAERVEGACPTSGGCPTSLMVSRSAPALIFAVDLLRSNGAYGRERTEVFRVWLRRIVLPVASDRDNNWGDAGTYLRAAIGATLGDRSVLEGAARRWRERLDLVRPDGQIPEEVRRGRASLMYSQDALDYKVATADILGRSGIDVWNERGERGGTLRAALELVADGLGDPGGWPVADGDLRVPDPSGVWAVAAARWPTATFLALARAAAEGDGSAHSAVLWTGVTHPVAS